MLLLLALIFLLINTLPVLAVALMRPPGLQRDVFAPLYVLTALNLLNVPYLVLLAFDPSALSPETKFSPWVRDLTSSMAAFVVVSSAGFLVMIAGMFSSLAPAIANALPRLHPARFTPARCYRAIVITGCVGAAVYAYFLNEIGGLSRLWLVIYNRTLITAGTGYLTFSYQLLFTFLGLLLAYTLRFRMTRLRRALVVLAMLLVAMVLASTGGRYGAVTVIILAMMTVHYGVRRFRRLLTVRTALVGAVVFVFVMVMPLFRHAAAHDRYTGHPDVLALDALRSMGTLAAQFSGADRGIVILNYFRPDRLWWGASYVDLLKAPIPRTMLPDKPPVDDGVYLMAIAQGQQVRPSVPARMLPVTAWPMGNWIFYMNFGIVGFLLGMFVAGAVTAAAYRYMQSSGYTPFGIYLYGFVVMGGFSWSNLGLVTFVMTVGLTTLIFWMLFGRKFTGLRPAGGAAPLPSPG